MGDQKPGSLMSALKSVVNAINPFKSTKSNSSISSSDSNQVRDGSFSEDGPVYYMSGNELKVGNIKNKVFNEQPKTKQNFADKARAMISSMYKKASRAGTYVRKLPSRVFGKEGSRGL